MYPKELTAARLIAFLCALSKSSSSKQILIHSLAGTNSAPRSAIRPMRLMVASCTFSCLFRRIGVMRGTIISKFILGLTEILDGGIHLGHTDYTRYSSFGGD